ncbi:MAG: alpha/beta hydrolase [Bradyrhizobiaceae bacterium]|nr:alpha/beta hydrolase [Bradyrhizobiaceae bacterium]
MASAQPKRRASPRLGIVLAAIAVVCLTALAVAVVRMELELTAPAFALIDPPRPDIRDDLHPEMVVIPSQSGANLAGWFVNGRPGGGAVVLMHGIKANRMSMVRRARLLHENGFSVLLFDFQAHGESGGTRITVGHLEALDARAAVEFVRRRLPDERVGAIGASLGGAAALLGPGPLPVDALVLEAVYPDVERALANRLRLVLGPNGANIAVPVLMPVFELFAPAVIGVWPSQLRPIDQIAEVTAPVLVIAGSNDRRTTLKETRELFARAREPKYLWVVEGADHVDLEAFAPDEYRRRVLPFLDRLRRSPQPEAR